MEERRAKTLEALSTFIQSQKALLSQTQRDIERLQQLRSEVASDPSTSFHELAEKIAASPLSLRERPGLVHTLPKDIDWSLFESSDPAPLREFAYFLRRAHSARLQPPPTQTSPLSPLQQLVKDSRATLLDPVLASYAFLNEPPSSEDEDDPPDPEELRRALEREKIRELKKRRLDADAGVPVFASLRRPVSHGVFIRRDQADESAEVDIDDAEEDGQSHVKSESDLAPMDVDTPPTSVPSPVSVAHILPDEKPGRRRRATQRAEAHVADRGRGKGKERGTPAKAHVKREGSPSASELLEEPPVEDSKQKGKLKSETYKQAWSVSEQHLLERLLEEIPDGEKNRWAKISKAMNGRRTARQVASRVQKYFEKLKRFGVDVGGSKVTS